MRNYTGRALSRQATLVQFIKFGLVGVSNTAVSMGIYYLFLWRDPKLYMVGSVLGAVISILNAFVWNNWLVFKAGYKSWKEIFTALGKCYLSYGGTSLLASGLLWLEVTFFHANKTIAPIFNLLLTIPLNFVLNKLWVFGKKTVYKDK